MKELEQTYLSIKRMMTKPFSTYKDRVSENAFCELVEYAKLLRRRVIRLELENFMLKNDALLKRLGDGTKSYEQLQTEVKRLTKKLKEAKS